MAGKPGRSGGHNRRSIAEHIASGTFRKDRHGPPTLSVAVARFPVLPPDAVPASLVDGLEAAGRGFVVECWQEFKNWSPPQRLLLKRCGQLVDLEISARGAGDVKTWQSLHRLLLLTVAGLGLRET